ncbi:hypothetical protein A2631_03975 [Candidatus Daviesbacteria bacterium RIFCSPHIGHO2_01_FULL_44_29]|uniref:8-oxo-dGTP diphosphatase n=1 Tax=Candidatus Daviesbacteria bacterium RIFCSPHIGHO2_02_FULL_43_12 TaxID=1797776 RepID=A0A1F5KGA9_9BACT|nr:MAG: hypothetical protein A2631_03975 [Candidatus Daviesbacteria bacterium RIFCSPHIGHO2_01_FULL_44_29]OGE39889.1 MAG: hypothetical protein A3D25_03705 [Candidatus Daviesbacteria bacterium RIFCSPHIGHO2_02_FULL_43_12]OGE40686.1 MAG: hypothetical protein A3E86_04255 [Candidatus Daviesbacteria bacterium RIFCSPHIGHO2_12_FULL_47_45]OGE70430.1 MAG: hypothetical protein A3B55_01865 [Candidatus Daviesbacteria bacterium RIFCSPLOWO2_01_FULL_43_15]
MLYLSKPSKFSPRFEVVGCFVESNEEILFLLRQDGKSEGNKWGVPAGKVDSDESPEIAICRELKEETGLTVPKIKHILKVYVKYSEYDFVFNMYKARLSQRQNILVKKDEHKDYQWVTPKQALGLNLVLDMDSCIKLLYNLDDSLG